jgi:hypothetical protein
MMQTSWEGRSPKADTDVPAENSVEEMDNQPTNQPTNSMEDSPS